MTGNPNTSPGVAAGSSIGAIGALAFGNPAATPSHKAMVDAASVSGPTPFPGVTLTGSGQGRRVEVVSGQYNSSVKGLAALLSLTTAQVFSALLGDTANEHILPAFYAWNLGDAWPGADVGRRRLRAQGDNFYATGYGNDIETGKTYEFWTIPASPKALRFPVSQGFLDRVAKARLAQQALAVAPAVEQLENDVRAIESLTARLRQDIATYRSITADYGKDIGAIMALHGMTEALLRYPKGDTDDVPGVTALKNKLEELHHEAVKNLVLNPPGPAGDMLKIQRDVAGELYRRVGDSAFVERQKKLLQNLPIIKGGDRIHQDLLRVVQEAYQQLLASPKCEEVVVNDVLPMIQAIAGTVPTPAAPDRTLTVLTFALTTTPSVVGNTPTPASLFVGVAAAAGPAIIRRAVDDQAGGRALAEALMKAMIRIGGVPPATEATLRAHVQNKDIPAARDLLGKYYMAGKGWSSAMAIINIVIFIVAMKANEKDTLAEWTNIVGSAAVSIASMQPLAAAFGAFRNLAERGLYQCTFKALGVIGGMAAVVTGVIAANDARKVGDDVGFWFATAGAVGGAISVAGLLIAAGASTTATVAGAPLGTVLMIAGAVIGLVSAIATIYRTLTTAGSQRVFEAYLSYIGRPGGPVNMAGQYYGRTLLWKAYMDLWTSFRSVGFWDISPDRVKELAQLGFSAPYVALLVDQDEAAVKPKMP